MNRFGSATVRLTFFYAVIVMLVSITFSFILYAATAQELTNHLNEDKAALDSLTGLEANKPIIDSLDNVREKRIANSERTIRIYLIYINGVVFILATVASYFLARKTLDPIEEMFEVQKRFTTDASHELRTPLTAMKTEIEVNIRDENLTVDEARSLLKSNLEEIEKLSTLSNGLLTLAKYQEGVDLDLKTVYLKDKIIKAYERVAVLAKKKNIEIKLKIGNIAVHGDEDSLVKLFIILLDNAIKYSAEGSKIQVKTDIQDRYAEVRVIDRGLGIEEADLPYIFNPFFRSEHSRSKKNSVGDGIGLSIAKKITEVHGGSIRVESRIGKGATFIVKLPFINRRRYPR